MENTSQAVILVKCPDQRGIVARLASAIHDTGGNILDAAQYTSESTNTFLQRIHVSWTDKNATQESFQLALNPLIESLQLDLQIKWGEAMRNVAIFVSKEDHCLHDLLLLQRDGALHCSISLVISNHLDLQDVAAKFNIPFHHIPIDDACAAEEEQLKLLNENNIDLVVLARYMRIVSPKIISSYEERIINIHHSFLPAFAGGKPYHQAHEKGVKLIGATAHYATVELDAGPIIEQGVIRVSHKDAVSNLVHKGRDIERTVLARAVRWHLEDRIIVHANRAVVFE
ncbi:MAG TPA: formyltetrahydrofolate deformylase [Phycisphaerales bacterium]|jgi:formyltetrahydrofolate deformylase|nr:formyltetrahydrofolate deformylase [Phycisphaerales bacterium]